MQIITNILIDSEGGWWPKIIDQLSGKHISGVHKVEMVLQAGEPTRAKLLIREAVNGSVQESEIGCPHVDLSPITALLEQVTCGQYKVDGDSWKLLPSGDIAVVFHKQA